LSDARRHLAPEHAPSGPFVRTPAGGRWRLCVVIINYKTPGLVEDCLATLETEIDPSLDVVAVVDNKSPDGSADDVARIIEGRGWSGWAHLVRSPVNGGFGYGNNTGMNAADAERYLLLNSDTLVRPGALSGMLNTLEKNPQLGAVGPRLEWPDEKPQHSAFRFKTPFTELIDAAATGPIDKVLRRHVTAIPLDRVRDEEPDWVSFACIMITREAIDRAGLMDEGYFMYVEDIDTCRLIRRAGLRVGHDPDSRVVHLRGGSGPAKEAQAKRKRLPRYVYESRARYYAKHYGQMGLITANLLWTLGWCISGLRRLLGRAYPTPEKASRDIWMNVFRPFAPSSFAPKAETTPGGHTKPEAAHA